MSFVALFFASLAGIGLVLSLGVHLAALAGFAPVGNAAFFGLHAGIFVVWFPAVFVAQRLSRDFKQKDLWKAVLRGCPPWMKRLTYGLGVYALVNFAYFLMVSAATGTKSSGAPDAETVRGFSGHWMAFYSTAMSILYSSTRISSVDALRRCARGHAVGPLAQFCEECGSPVIGSPPAPPVG